VKKLSKTDEFSEKQFEDEVTCLIRVKHKNIVRFLGYCSDTQKQVVSYNGKYVMAEVRQRLLCFEYAPNKTLYDYLKGMNMATTLFVSLTYYLRPKKYYSSFILSPTILMLTKFICKVQIFMIARSVVIFIIKYGMVIWCH
jgi:serine/threonine protein kinase